MIAEVKICENCYVKDPNSSDLGKRIIQHSINLIDEIGFEAFTFKKLAILIDSTEASVYRYFENKHKLLVYLLAWYWNWVDYRFQFDADKFSSPKNRLEGFIDYITKPIKMDYDFIHVDEVALHRIVIAESAKAYLTKEVDLDNRDGYFLAYKKFVKSIVVIIKAINPQYPFPAALVSTIIESAHNQKYFSDHLPSLSETRGDHSISNFLKDLVFKSISNEFLEN